MPADRPNIGTGRRRQGATEPDRTDDRNRSLERALDDEPTADDGYERGKVPGARGADPAQGQDPGKDVL